MRNAQTSRQRVGETFVVSPTKPFPWWSRQHEPRCELGIRLGNQRRSFVTIGKKRPSCELWPRPQFKQELKPVLIRRLRPREAGPCEPRESAEGMLVSYDADGYSPPAETSHNTETCIVTTYYDRAIAVGGQLAIHGVRFPLSAPLPRPGIVPAMHLVMARAA
jgi:hypothetical protein